MLAKPAKINVANMTSRIGFGSARVHRARGLNPWPNKSFGENANMLKENAPYPVKLRPIIDYMAGAITVGLAGNQLPTG